MTLSGMLSPSVGPTSPGQMPMPDIDRTEWSWSNKGGGGWKGGKGNPNAALSALTLLAFLFFLNILQSCLKDSLNQNPGVVVMMMPTPTSAAARVKRETQPPARNLKGENYEWDDTKITELVHQHVESQWSSNKTKQFKSNLFKAEQNLLNESRNKRISTKLHMIRTTTDNYEVSNDKSTHEILKGLNTTRKEKPSMTANWIEIVTKAVKISKPLMRRFLCCEYVICEHSKNKENFYKTSKSQLWNMLLWFCGGQSFTSCADYTVRHCENPFVRNLLQNQSASNMTGMG